MSRQGSFAGPAETLRVRLLGGFSVSVGPRTIEQDAWRLQKATILIKLLALAPGHRLHREQVMNLLWPDSGREAASNSLRQTLHAARRILATDTTASSQYLSTEDEEIVLSPKGQVWVDVEAFEQAAATARRSLDPAAYRAVIELYAGELLPGDLYEDWAEARRQELRTVFLALLVELSGLCEQRGEYRLAIDALRRLLAVDPTHEQAHTGLMRLFALSGRRLEALRQYEKLRQILSKELAAEPTVATRRLREEIAEGTFPLLRQPQPSMALPMETPRLRMHNLPAARTRFVGREHETEGTLPGR